MISIAIISTLSDCYCYGAQAIDITNGTTNNSSAGQYESLSVSGGGQLAINGNTSDVTNVSNSSAISNTGLIPITGTGSKATVDTKSKCYIKFF